MVRTSTYVSCLEGHNLTHNIKPYEKNELSGHSQLGCWEERAGAGGEPFTSVPESFACLSCSLYGMCSLRIPGFRKKKKKELPKSQEISNNSAWLLTVIVNCQESGFSWKVM